MMAKAAAPPLAPVTGLRSRIVRSEAVDPASIQANPRNWRVHGRGQRRALAGSLETVGWVQQVIVNVQTGNLVDGHARVEEALERHEATVPVLYVDLSPEEEALVLATLDPLAAMAETNQAALDALLADVTVDDAGLRRLLADLGGPKAGLTDPDEVPEVPAEPYVRANELWILGDHRLLVGDATNPADVARVLGGGGTQDPRDGPALRGSARSDLAGRHLQRKHGPRIQPWRSLYGRAAVHADPGSPQHHPFRRHACRLVGGLRTRA